MHKVRLKEAKVRLAELINEAEYGAEVVITNNGRRTTMTSHQITISPGIRC